MGLICLGKRHEALDNEISFDMRAFQPIYIAHSSEMTDMTVFLWQGDQQFW